MLGSGLNMDGKLWNCSLSATREPSIPLPAGQAAVLNRYRTGTNGSFHGSYLCSSHHSLLCPSLTNGKGCCHPHFATADFPCIFAGSFNSKSSGRGSSPRTHKEYTDLHLHMGFQHPKPLTLTVNSPVQSMDPCPAPSTARSAGLALHLKTRRRSELAPQLNRPEPPHITSAAAIHCISPRRPCALIL